jgi:hypothetical protein
MHVRNLALPNIPPSEAENSLKKLKESRDDYEKSYEE